MGISAGMAALIGGGIAGAGSIASGAIGANAAGNAADAQANAANNAANLQRQTAIDALNFNKQQYGNSLNIMAPWVNTGQSANSRLAYLMGLTPNQGLPPGVVNPNTVASGPTGPNTGGSSANRLKALAPSPDMPPISAGGNFQPFGAQGGQVPMLGSSPANPAPGINPSGVMPISNNPGITPNFNGSPANPALGALNPNDPNQISGAPGTVPIQGGSITPGPVIDASTNVGGTGQVPFLTPGTSGVPAGGGFGSLAQGWNQTFTSPTDVTEQNDPGYQFRLQQGQDALQNSAAARGGLLSGGTAKAINDYAQNSASNEYSNVYNRALQNYNTNYNTFSNDQSNLFNRLSALSGTGQVSANQLSNAGLNTSNTNANIGLTSAGQIGQNINNAGAANASGYVGGANAIGGAISGATNSLGGALSLYQLLNMQNQGGGNSNAGYGVI